MMKKLLLMAFAVLGLAANAMADDELSVAVIAITGDTVQTAALATIDKVEFEGDSLLVIATDGEKADTTKYARKDVDKLLFGADLTPTGIKSLPAAAADKVIIAAQGSEFSVSGIKAGTLVAVFDTNGRLAAQVKAGSDTVSLDATGLKKGIYIVRAGNKAVKIIKK